MGYMLYSTVAIDPSNIDPIKGYNALSYPKLHVKFEYNNLLEPVRTWETVLRVYIVCDSDVISHCWLLRSKNESQALITCQLQKVLFISRANYFVLNGLPNIQYWRSYRHYSVNTSLILLSGANPTKKIDLIRTGKPRVRNPVWWIILQ